MNTNHKLGCQQKDLKTQTHHLSYWECGQGDPIVFLTGVPGCAQDWLSVMTVLSSLGHCLALDFPGAGKSISLMSDFSIHSFVKVLSDWIDALKLNRITWVLHGVGAVVGLDYILRHQNQTKAMVFYEPFWLPVTDQLSLPLEQQIFLASQQSEYFSEQFIKQLILESSEKLTQDMILEQVSSYMQSSQCKEIIKMYFSDLKKGSSFLKHIHQLTLELESLALPKLLLYSIPGFMLDMASIEWARKRVSNLEIMEAGEEWHFAHLIFGKRMGESISAWLQAIEQKRK